VRVVLVVAGLAVLGLTAPRTARAEGDYDPGSTAWNGLSALSALAAGGGVTLEPRTRVAWDELGGNDVLFLLYPRTRVDPVQLAAFLRGGGRVLIGDDFGRADEALARLGLLRHPGPLGPARVHDQNPNLPVAVALDDQHPLARGVGEIVTNHPSVFSVESGADAVFGTSKREAVVAAGTLGNGRFVALSDPSIFINDMLAFDGNVALAVRVLDYLAPRRPARILLVTGDATMTGQAKDTDEAEGGPSLNELIADVITAIDEWNDYLAPEPVLRGLAMFGGFGVLLTAALVLPVRRGREPDSGFARVAGELATTEHLCAEYDDGAPERNFAFPAAVLREQVEVELEQRSARAPAASVGRGRALRALELVRALPPRAAVLSMAAHVSRKTFLEATAATTDALASEKPE
jgi:hypothetical protein